MCIHVSLCVWCNARRTVQVVPGIFCSIIFSPPDGRSTTKGTYVESRLEIIQLCSSKPFICLGRTIHIAFIVDAADMHIVGISCVIERACLHATTELRLGHAVSKKYDSR